MAWIRRSAGDLDARQARSKGTVILTAAGAVCVAAACVACGAPAGSSPTTPVANAAASGSAIASAGGSGSGSPSGGGSGSASSGGGGGRASGCSSQGIGGDTFSPLACASPSSHSNRGVSGPESPSNAPTTPPPTSIPVTTAPQVTAISPTSGNAVGGATVTITGSGFINVTAVEFGGVSAPQKTVVSDTQITAKAPPGNGTVDVTVVTPSGTSPTTSADKFSYQGVQPS